jgi:hypothetical protein
MAFIAAPRVYRASPRILSRVPETRVEFTGALPTLAMAALVLVGMVGGLALTALRQPADAPGRLVAELRLAQLAATVLAFVAGGYVGLAAASPAVPGTGLDVALALGFLVLAATAPSRDPREALTLIGAGWAAHAIVDVLHRPGWLADAAVPPWYALACAALNLLLALACLAPLVRR